MHTYDLIIVGAGAMGSAAAYHAARAGQRALLLEQFEIDHQYGSSYGLSRIIRYAYDHPAYIQMAKRAYPMWAALEEEAGETLFVKTGGIDFAFLDNAPSLQNTIASLRAENIPHEILTAREAEQRFPQYRFDDAMTVVYQGDTGMLAASKCVRAHMQLARERGAVVCDSTPVQRIEVHPDSVTVHTGSEMHSAGRLILAAGSWMNQLLSHLDLRLPLQALKSHEVYFQPSSTAGYEPGRMPVFIAHAGSFVGESYYGIPSFNESGVKAALHGGQPVAHPVDYTPDTAVVDKIRSFTHRYLPALADAPLLSIRTCLYTMTPDTHFIIDHHPMYPHVIIASPCSGHGFKFSTLIGKILCDLALEGRTDVDLSLFTIGRYTAA